MNELIFEWNFLMWCVIGTYTLWSIAVFIWIFKLTSTKFCMVITASWSCRLCHWMCTTECHTVCRISTNQTTCKMCGFIRCKFITQTYYIQNSFNFNIFFLLFAYLFSFTILQCFWALGACFEVALALAVAPTLGWRWLLGLSSAPLFIFACITPVRFHSFYITAVC